MKVLVLSALARDTGSCLRAQSLARSLAPHCDVEFVPAPARSLPLMLELLLSAPGYFLRVLRSDADCFIAVKPMPNVTLPLLVMKRLRGRVIVVDVDDMDDGYFSGWRAALIRFVQKPGPKRFDLATYHNQNLRELLCETFGVTPERVHRVLQGVDLDVFSPRQSEEAPGRLLYVGHLNIASELPWILAAVRRLREGRNVRLTVAGGGPCLEEFAQLARDLGVDAQFTGALAPAQVADEIGQADVCLVYYAPTEVNRHRSSMKVRECLAMGKKVVCNDFDELDEFRSVAYLSSSDADDFVRTVEAALDGGDGRERGAAAFIRARYDWNEIGRDLNLRLQSLTSACEDPGRDGRR